MSIAMGKKYVKWLERRIYGKIRRLNIVVSGATANSPDRIHLLRRCIMDTLPSHAKNGKILFIFPRQDPSHQHYVYTLAFPDGKVFYVGKGIRGRIHIHENEAIKGVKSYKCNTIRYIWSKGEEVVKTKVAFFATHEEALEYEVALIFFMDGLTNLTSGGDGKIGATVSEEVRIKRNRKISEANKNSPRVHEQLIGLREKQKGVPRSKEVRDKIREKLIGQPGRPHTDESRRKIGASNKGRFIPETTRQAVAEANRKRVISEATRHKLSEAHKGKKRNKNHISNQYSLWMEGGDA